MQREIAIRLAFIWPVKARGPVALHALREASSLSLRLPVGRSDISSRLPPTHLISANGFVRVSDRLFEGALVVCGFGEFQMPGQLPSYLHRVNYDGTFDSICIRCFETIALAIAEDRLALAE